ncbi:hypothetical protein [Rhizobium sp. Root1220]|uniref:hypothetical protein n=1 Tax=Rhizobium sp. Root1220 TaxID=1736432 RepID=UPI0006FAC87A|nr:hypothetical protein [Rhizobium sp. Root1220]KQV65229.1 hypothetical protein ASC90_15215 [Rhizobium sp. Root1220]
MDSAARDSASSRSEAQLKDLAALARLVAFACETARDLGAEFPATCLESALGGLLRELDDAAVFDDKPSPEATAMALH